MEFSPGDLTKSHFSLSGFPQQDRGCWCCRNPSLTAENLIAPEVPAVFPDFPACWMIHVLFPFVAIWKCTRVTRSHWAQIPEWPIRCCIPKIFCWSFDFPGSQIVPPWQREERPGSFKSANWNYWNVPGNKGMGKMIKEYWECKLGLEILAPG